MSKIIFDNTVSNRDSKIAENKTKNESIRNELKNLKTFYLGYFIGKSQFEEDGAQNYVVFQPTHKYFKIPNTKYILSWKSKGLSDETITPYATSDNSLTPLIDHYGIKVRVKFNGTCLKQSNKLIYDYGRKGNIYTVYEFGAPSSNDNNPTLKNCSFVGVTLTKNTDIEKYGYSDYGNGFDSRSTFSFPGGGFSQNVLTFGVI